MIDCPYCSKPATLVRGETLYNLPDLRDKNFWACRPCNAHVGCHPAGRDQGDGTKPLGTLANAPLRRERNRAHAAFDPLWRGRKMTRGGAYAWLARALGLGLDDCHIGLFNEEQCRAVVAAVADLGMPDSAEASTPVGLRIFTDGSVFPNPGNGGWSFVAYEGSKVVHEAFGGAPDTTNNRMEMTGIIEALKWAGDRPCDIFSDSELCVRTLNEWARAWQKRGWRKADGKAPMNADLVRYAYPLYLGSKAKLQWVRGHNGTEGNERADELALRGRLEAKRVSVSPSRTDCFRSLDN